MAHEDRKGACGKVGCCSAAVLFYCSPFCTDQPFPHQAEGLLEEKTHTSLLCPKGKVQVPQRQGLSYPWGCTCAQSMEIKQTQCGV